MARQAVTSGQLSRIDGIDEVQREITRRLALLRHSGQAGQTGDALKRVYFEAAEPLYNDIRTNILSLPLDPSAKDVLRQQLVRGRGPRRFPNAFIAMYQWAANIAARKAAGGRVPNPYWFEYGTKPRQTKRGHKTGQIRPTPFFRPAIPRNKAAVANKLVDGLRRVLVEGED